jgi:leucyl/phenylalanyl-tRNA--protein transferase
LFSGESMFSTASGGSKVALAALAMRLAEWGWPIIDAQVENPHLMSLGAEQISRREFLSAVARLTSLPEPAGSWTQRFGELNACALTDG